MSTALRPPCDEGVLLAGARAEAPCAPSREGWVLAATVAGSSLAFVDGTIVNVALPVLQAELGASGAGAQWVVESYLLFLAALLLAGGALGDRTGRRRVFGWGTVVFALASLVCAWAPTLPALVAGRALQGVGAALLVPNSLALLSASVPPERRGRAIGAWSMGTAVAAGLGPLAGGWLVEAASWRWAFVANLPVAAIILLLLVRVPESRDPSPRPLDVPGALLATLGLGGVVWALVEAAVAGWGAPVVWVPGALGVACLAAFVAVERRSPDAMLPPDLLARPAFAGANLLTLFLYAALGAVMFYVPFVLLQVRGWTATAAGAAFLPFTVLMFVMARPAGALADRRGPRLPLVIGPAVAAAGMAGMGLAGSDVALMAALTVMALGMSLAVVPLTATVMAAAGERAGVASGVNNAVARTAGLVAVAAAGLLVTARFEASLAERLDALALPAATRAVVEAGRDRLGAAALPPEYPAPLRGRVDEAVDGAFLDAFRDLSLAAGALALAAAATAALTLGGRPSPP